MLADMGLLEWEDCDLSLRQGVPVEGEREADGDDGVGVEWKSSTTTPSPPSIVLCNAIAESLRDRPDHVGVRPRMVYPSLLRTDWDSELTAAGLEHLSRLAA